MKSLNETYPTKHQWTLSNYKLSREKCYLHTVKMQYFIREGESFIRVSKHEKADESTRPKAECFCCFRVFENPDETWSSSLWNGSSKGPTLLTINTKTERPRKYSVFVLFCFIVACAWLLVSVMKDVVFFHNFGFLNNWEQSPFVSASHLQFWVLKCRNHLNLAHLVA